MSTELVKFAIAIWASSSNSDYPHNAWGLIYFLWCSYLQLLQSETSTGPRAAVILDSRALDDGSQTVDRAGSHAGSFGDTGITTTVLTASLLEVHLDPALPVLVEVPIGDDVVVLDRLDIRLVNFLRLAQDQCGCGGSSRLRCLQ